MFDVQRHVQVRMNRHGVASRRDFLKSVSLAGLAAGTLSWPDLMASQADQLRRRGMACILLWMQGGPSQFETFDPKPGHANGGDTKAIATKVPGIQIAEHLPHLAQVADQLAIVRSMTSREGNHQRATFLMHTGYIPTASVKHPTFGSLVVHELPNSTCQLPAFVQIGGGRRGNLNGGFLGVEYDPFTINKAEKLPDNSSPTTSVDRYQRRLGLLERLETDYAAAGASKLVADHQKLYNRASRMVLAKEMEAFDISQESPSTRAAYGEGDFAAGCLLARRLIESGVTFVEIEAGGWDTHADNFKRVPELSGKIDQPFTQLLHDLGQRGLLDSTLVVWMGEFGRTPKINGRGGRDHFPKCYNAVLAGGGIRGGQVIGATVPSGDEVADRPVTVPDLFQTFCQSLKIDPNVENMSPIGRPIKNVDGGQAISELLA